MKAINCSIVILSFFLFSCNGFLKENESKDLLTLTKAKNIEVNEEGKDIVVNIYESKLTNLNVVNLYSSTIAVRVFGIGKRKKNILFYDGNCVINFMNSDSIISSRKFPYTELFDIVEVYKSMNKVLQSICENNESSLLLQVDNDIFSSEERKGFIKILLSSDLCLSKIDYTIYGYVIESENSLDKKIISVYVNFSQKNDRNIVFNYLKKSKKLVGVEEL